MCNTTYDLKQQNKKKQMLIKQKDLIFSRKNYFCKDKYVISNYSVLREKNFHKPQTNNIEIVFSS